MARIRETEGHLEIRIRHYGMRFLCLVFFIVSIVAYNNPKQPDGRILSAAFAVATVILLLMTRAVTIDLDRLAGSFAIHYGGVVFGFPTKTLERPLQELRFVNTEITSGSGLTYTRPGRGSRVVFVFASGEKVPLTRFFSGGDMGEHHEIERSVNDFLKHRAGAVHARG